MAQEQLERYLSTGELPDPNDLPYKMYAVVRDGIVEGYTWESSDDPTFAFILMTYENSPAWTKGKYIDGKFYAPEGEK